MQSSEVLIKEYLAYRGFSGSLKSFENECKNDRIKSFRSDKILEAIQIAINSHDLQEVMNRNVHGNTNFISHFLIPAQGHLENPRLILLLKVGTKLLGRCEEARDGTF